MLLEESPQSAQVKPAPTGSGVTPGELDAMSPKDLTKEVLGAARGRGQHGSERSPSSWTGWAVTRPHPRAHGDLEDAEGSREMQGLGVERGAKGSVPTEQDGYHQQREAAQRF